MKRSKLLLVMMTLMFVMILAIGPVASITANQLEGPSIALQEVEVDIPFLLAEPVGGGSSGT